MKKLILFMAIIAFAGCAETKRHSSSNNDESGKKDSVIQKRKEHKISSHYSAMKHWYKMHDPDCPLCKEMRKQETIAIVDSMLKERSKK